MNENNNEQLQTEFDVGFWINFIEAQFHELDVEFSHPVHVDSPATWTLALRKVTRHANMAMRAALAIARVRETGSILYPYSRFRTNVESLNYATVVILEGFDKLRRLKDRFWVNAKEEVDVIQTHCVDEAITYIDLTREAYTLFKEELGRCDWPEDKALAEIPEVLMEALEEFSPTQCPDLVRKAFNYSPWCAVWGATIQPFAPESDGIDETPEERAH